MPAKQTDKYKVLPGITYRFMQVALDIISKNTLNQGPYATQLAFSESVGMHHQSFTYLVKRYKNLDRAVTLSAVANLITIHHANPTFIFKDQGPMYSDGSMPAALPLTKIVRRVEKKAEPKKVLAGKRK